MEAPPAGRVPDHSQDLPAWFKPSFLDIPEDVAEAAGQGKRLMLFFHQDGCGACQRFYDENFGDQAIVNTTQRYFDVVAIDINGNRALVDMQGRDSYENQFARRIKGQVTPTVMFLNERAEIILRIPGFIPRERFMQALKYVAEHREQQLGFDEYLERQR
ncbi:MAG: hypothetical protein A2V90_08110 [Gammaproteobacteria bacterium RBG_16_57_12]|nr:MAG: hypothetical protein A2V90_08110 [Gammaproteobacteria bacterium RBG_16_57_12]